jgi:phosphatidylserine decarboxylase
LLIARGGRVFVVLSIVAALVSIPFSLVAVVGFAALTGFLAFVFRDPKRDPGEGVVSPADGIVREVSREDGLVSIYLALTNVHVTRSPVAGAVTKTTRIPGKHFPAYSKRSPNNERLELLMDTDLGEIRITQMSGILARRIVPYVGTGNVLGKGQKLGLIRFGSRVDLRLPPDKVSIRVKVGDRTRAGITCVAEATDDGSG